MSYYQGDYYQGDYYQGDPFFGALLGAGVSWLGKKLLGRGAKAAAAGTVAKVGAGAATGLATGIAGGTLGGLMLPPAMRMAKKGADLFYRSSGTTRPPDFTTTVYGDRMAGCCPSGFHMAKDGSDRCVRNRSMNVANPRALRRSLRRVSGFAKLAKRSRTAIKKAAREV